MDNVPVKTHVISVMTSKLLETLAPASHLKAKQSDGEGQKTSMGSGSQEESSFDTSEIPCRFKFCKTFVM